MEKYYPDYEIVEWNEDNFNVNICDYVKEAYAEKKVGLCFRLCKVLDFV